MYRVCASYNTIIQMCGSHHLATQHAAKGEGGVVVVVHPIRRDMADVQLHGRIVSGMDDPVGSRTLAGDVQLRVLLFLLLLDSHLCPYLVSMDKACSSLC